MIETIKFIHGNKEVSLSGIRGDYILEEIKRNKMFYDQHYLNYLEEKYNICDKTVIDIGANIGNHSIFFKKFMKCGKIYCFEPIKELRECLELNILELTNWEDFIIYSFAIGIDDEVQMGMKSSFNMGTYRKNGNFDIQIVKCVTLDSLIFQEPIELIKIDVEGMEYDVLLSAKETIQRLKSKIIILESWDIPETMNTCGKFLYQFGYKLQPIFDLRNTENCWNLEFVYE